MAQAVGNKLELLLAESLRVAHAAGALRSQDLKRVRADTVQPKAITFPTDAKLLHAHPRRGGERQREPQPLSAQTPLSDIAAVSIADKSAARRS